MEADRVQTLLTEIRACQQCRAHLPHGIRPVLQAAAAARLLVVGQAPGRKAHASGIPFDDASGERLRDWLGIDRATFYDTERVAVVPMGFCFPGSGPNGDLPPRPECAPLWHPRLVPLLSGTRLTLLVSRHAQAAMLGGGTGASLTERVRQWRAHLVHGLLPLPHPSPRNQAWLKHHPWFADELLPVLRQRVADVLGSASAGS